MPPKPIASTGCDTTLFLCKKLTFKIKIYSQTQGGGQGGASAHGRRPEGGAKILPKNFQKFISGKNF